eukprot:1154344-Pelagomonas_calceolata.AAC.10
MASCAFCCRRPALPAAVLITGTEEKAAARRGRSTRHRKAGTAHERIPRTSRVPCVHAPAVAGRAVQENCAALKLMAGWPREGATAAATASAPAAADPFP